MKRTTAPAAVLLLLTATLTACGNAPDDCDAAAPMAYVAAPERPSGHGSKGGSSHSSSKSKPAKTKAKSSKPKKPKHHSHHDSDICEDDD
ncbi:hypothetical protein [Streptomyces sp. XH2]|uniref:hypothetical protein n=1 Tax=Streptomyces sp. XH2 TaxID=3412483 RepID=UPI003C7C0441